MYISDFTNEICCELQGKISRVTFAKSVSTSANTKDGIGTFNGKINTRKRAKRKFEAGLAQFKNENGVMSPRELRQLPREDTPQHCLNHPLPGQSLLRITSACTSF
jgi:hypothetical protein